ncbi:hypothetical protein FXO38_09839 [Capsicum annuum]|nr:hypothetical protein FXO37_28758 [Capsicum annuum]KAF3665009.1 hypothetical protein FXO38_09839 [Capsicum annuum]
MLRRIRKNNFMTLRKEDPTILQVKLPSREEELLKLFPHTSFLRFLLCNQDATQHLFEVAAGLDSLVLGEGQILAQVKQVVKNGQEVPGAGRKIGDLFKHAIIAGKRVRTEINIFNGSVSVNSVVVELALLKLSEYSSCTTRILVVRAGKMGRLIIFTKVHSEMIIVSDLCFLIDC